MDTTTATNDEQARQRRMEAICAHEEAKDERARLILEARRVARKHREIAALFEVIEIDPEFPLQSEAAILALSGRHYEGLGFEPERELANTIAASRKAVADAAEIRRVQRG